MTDDDILRIATATGPVGVMPNTLTFARAIERRAYEEICTFCTMIENRIQGNKPEDNEARLILAYVRAHAKDAT